VTSVTSFEVDDLVDIGPSNLSIIEIEDIINNNNVKAITAIFHDLEDWKGTLWKSILENIRIHLTDNNRKKNTNGYELKSNTLLWKEYNKVIIIIRKLMDYIDPELLEFSTNISQYEIDINGKIQVEYFDSGSDDFKDITSQTTISNTNDNYCNPEYVSYRYNTVIPLSQKLIDNARSRLETIGREHFKSGEKEDIQVLSEEDRYKINFKSLINCSNKKYDIDSYLFGQMSLSLSDRYHAEYSVKSYKRIDTNKNVIWNENVRILMNGKIPRYVSKDWKPTQSYSSITIKIPINSNILTMRRRIFEKVFDFNIQTIDKKIGVIKYKVRSKPKFIRRKISIQEIISFSKINIGNYKKNNLEFCEFININKFCNNNYISDFAPSSFIEKEVDIFKGGGLPFIGSWQLAPNENMEYSRIHNNMGKLLPYCIYGENAKFIRDSFIKFAYDGKVNICKFMEHLHDGSKRVKLQIWKLFRFKDDKYMVVFGDLR
jgi:hypothetical protein